MWIERLILISVVTTSVIIFFIPYASAQQKTYTIYVEPNSLYSTYLSGVMEDATTNWHNANPNINFILTNSPQQPYDFEVQWIKDNTGGPWAGEALIPNHIMQVTLGDSACGGTWKPYSHTTLVSLASHELGHLLGLGHSTDPNNVMNPNRDDFEYAQRQYVQSLPSGGSFVIPLCNLWDGSSFSYKISTDDLGIRYDFINGGGGYVNGEGCSASMINGAVISGMCSGIGKNGALMVTSLPMLVNSFATVQVLLTDTTTQPSYYIPQLPQEQPSNLQGQSTTPTPSPNYSNIDIIGIHDPNHGYVYEQESAPIRIPIGTSVALHFINEDKDTGSQMDLNIDAFNVHTNNLSYFQAQTITFTADKEGTFIYYSNLHPEMNGQIIVTNTIPEFSSLTGMITAMSIIGVIVISSKFR